MAEIELKNISKVYKTGKVRLKALDNVSLEVPRGGFVAIMGPSGSGKSTLMHIIGLLDRPTSGNLSFGGEDINMKMADRKLAKLRSRKIGFVFQQFNLLPRITALANVLMPTAYAHKKTNFVKRAHELLGLVGLSGREQHKSSELSGGEIQRVAIARALINNPDIILADEPTGNLDSRSGQEVLRVLTDLNKEGKTIILITHDSKIAAYAGKIIHIFDGKIQEDNND